MNYAKRVIKCKGLLFTEYSKAVFNQPRNQLRTEFDPGKTLGEHTRVAMW